MNIYKDTFEKWQIMALRVRSMGSYLQNPEELTLTDTVDFQNEYEKLHNELTKLAASTHYLLPKVKA